MANNLWGSFDDVMEDINNPKDILEEQALVLEDNMSGFVKGQMKRKVLNKAWIDFYVRIDQEYDFTYDFVILSDYVEKYSYEMLTVAYGIRMYPAAVTVSTSIIEELEQDYNVYDTDTVIAENEAMFNEILMKIFASKEVRQVLRGLRSIAKKEYEENEDLF